MKALKKLSDFAQTETGDFLILAVAVVLGLAWLFGSGQWGWV